MILHADLNSFFARVEQQSNPKLRNRPIGVLGKGHKGAKTCVCAASPEAKKFGVKSGFSVWEAQKLCPNIILVPPNYETYLDVSRRFIAILENFTPWVEIFSIDEAFFDLPKASPQEAIEIATQIKQKLRTEIGELVTASIGIAWGKTFAKLAGELKKPDGLIILNQQTWLDQVGDLAATEICGIGRHLGGHLINMNIRTIADLSRADAGQLCARFGRSTGMKLWNFGQGIDNSPVNPTSHLGAPKSIGHQSTLDKEYRFDQINRITEHLTKKVGRRLRRHQLIAKRLSLTLSLANGEWKFVQHTFNPSLYSDQSLHNAIRYLKKSINIPNWWGVKRVGVVAYNLQLTANQTLPLFQQERDQVLLTPHLDKLRDRYGESIIEWGSAYGFETGIIRDWRGPRAVLDN